MRALRNTLEIGSLLPSSQVLLTAPECSELILSQNSNFTPCACRELCHKTSCKTVCHYHSSISSFISIFYLSFHLSLTFPFHWKFMVQILLTSAVNYSRVGWFYLIEPGLAVIVESARGHCNIAVHEVTECRPFAMSNSTKRKENRNRWVWTDTTCNFLVYISCTEWMQGGNRGRWQEGQRVQGCWGCSSMQVSMCWVSGAGHSC